MTNVALCNRALIAVGEAPTVTSLSPPTGSAHAQLCATMFDAAVEFVTESRHWTHTDKRAALSKVALASPSADATTDIITTSVAHGLAVGNPVTVALSVAGEGSLPEPLEVDTVYYVASGVSTLTLSLTETEGGYGTVIDLTTAGTGQWRVLKESDRDGWAYMYELPSDCLTERNVVPSGGADDWPGANGAGRLTPAPTNGLFYPPEHRSHGRAQRVPFKRAQNDGGELVIYTNVEDAHLVYTAYADDVTQWPPNFKEAVVAKLAAGLIGRIKQDARAVREFEALCQQYIGEAARTDAQRGVPDETRGYAWDR